MQLFRRGRTRTNRDADGTRPGLISSRCWTTPVAAIVILLAVPACQESRTGGFDQRPLPPKPHAAPRTPDSARVDALVLNVSSASSDTNANGFPDLIQTTVHLFDTRFPAPMREDGVVVFDLLAPGSAGRGLEPLRTWRFEGASLQATEARSTFGDCYQFRLSLLEDGNDLLPFATADLRARFEPDDGRKPVLASEVSTIQMGHRAAGVQ